jgi:transcriptional regulator with XRE-family HTH domain
MTKRKQSTFDRVMQNPKQKKAFDKEYSQFLFSELVLEAMEEQKISVRKLAQKSGVSTSIIQNLRSMKPANITLKTLSSLLDVLGYELRAKKNGKEYRLSS